MENTRNSTAASSSNEPTLYIADEVILGETPIRSSQRGPTLSTWRSVEVHIAVDIMFPRPLLWLEQESPNLDSYNERLLSRSFLFPHPGSFHVNRQPREISRSIEIRYREAVRNWLMENINFILFLRDPIEPAPTSFVPICNVSVFISHKKGNNTEGSNGSLPSF